MHFLLLPGSTMAFERFVSEVTTNGLDEQAMTRLNVPLPLTLIRVEDAVWDRPPLFSVVIPRHTQLQFTFEGSFWRTCTFTIGVHPDRIVTLRPGDERTAQRAQVDTTDEVEIEAL